MSSHSTEFQGSVIDAIRTSIQGAIEGASVQVTGGGGHYSIIVTSQIFAGKGMVDSQRLIYGSIAHLMQGEGAPVHAVDSLKTRTP